MYGTTIMKGGCFFLEVEKQEEQKKQDTIGNTKISGVRARSHRENTAMHPLVPHNTTTKLYINPRFLLFGYCKYYTVPCHSSTAQLCIRNILIINKATALCPCAVLYRTMHFVSAALRHRLLTTDLKFRLSRSLSRARALSLNLSRESGGLHSFQTILWGIYSFLSLTGHVDKAKCRNCKQRQIVMLKQRDAIIPFLCYTTLRRVLARDLTKGLRGKREQVRDDEHVAM